MIEWHIKFDSSWVIQHPDNDKIKIHVAESEEAFKFLFRERWKTFRKTANISIWNRLAARTGYPCSGCLHGYRCYLHVASQSLTLLFKICHMLTLCVGSFLLQDMYLSLQVLALVGKSLTHFVNKQTFRKNIRSHFHVKRRPFCLFFHKCFTQHAESSKIGEYWPDFPMFSVTWPV